MKRLLTASLLLMATQIKCTASDVIPKIHDVLINEIVHEMKAGHETKAGHDVLINEMKAGQAGHETKAGHDVLINEMKAGQAGHEIITQASGPKPPPKAATKAKPTPFTLSADRDFQVALEFGAVNHYVENFITRRFRTGCEKELSKVRTAVKHVITADILYFVSPSLRVKVKEAKGSDRRLEEVFRRALESVIDQLLNVNPLHLNKVRMSQLEIKDMPIGAIWFITEYSVDPPIGGVIIDFCTSVKLEAFNEYKRDIPKLKVLVADNNDLEKIVIMRRLPGLEKYSLEMNEIKEFNLEPGWEGSAVDGINFKLSLYGNPIRNEAEVVEALEKVFGERVDLNFEGSLGS